MNSQSGNCGILKCHHCFQFNMNCTSCRLWRCNNCQMLKNSKWLLFQKTTIEQWNYIVNFLHDIFQISDYSFDFISDLTPIVPQVKKIMKFFYVKWTILLKINISIKVVRKFFVLLIKGNIISKNRILEKKYCLFLSFCVSLEKMSEQISSSFDLSLNKICNMIVSLDSLYEEMSQIDLTRSEWDEFFHWYDEAMNFLREQRDILQSWFFFRKCIITKDLLFPNYWQKYCIILYISMLNYQIKSVLVIILLFVARWKLKKMGQKLYRLWYCH